MTWDRATKAAAAAIGAVAGYFGKWDATMTVLAVVMAVDYASGLLVAACGRSPKTPEGGLSSRAGFMGIARKGVIMLIVLLAALLDRAVGGAQAFRTGAAMYYIANEGLSILENAALLDVPFPAKLRGALEELKSGEKKSGSQGESDQ